MAKTGLNFGKKSTTAKKFELKAEVMTALESSKVVATFNRDLELNVNIVPANGAKDSMSFSEAGSFDTLFNGLTVRAKEQAKTPEVDLYAAAFQKCQAHALAVKHGTITAVMKVVDKAFRDTGAEAVITITETGITADIDGEIVPAKAGSTNFCAKREVLSPFKSAELAAVAKAAEDAKANATPEQVTSDDLKSCF